MAIRKGRNSQVFVAKFENGAVSGNAVRPLYQTNFQESTDVGTMDEETKDGVITDVSNIAYTWTNEQLIDTEDAGFLLLQECFKTKKKVIIWLVDLDSKTSNGRYTVQSAVASISKFDTDADVTDFVKLSSEFKISGEPITGQEELNIFGEENSQEYISLADNLKQG